MGFPLGWKFREKRTGIWKGDEALANVPPEVIAEWEKDGLSIHLAPYALNGEPQLFTFRALNSMEMADAMAGNTSTMQVFIECVRIGVRLKGSPPESMNSPEGVPVGAVVKEGRTFKLSMEFLDGTFSQDFIIMYGALIYKASVPTEPEKKALSPQSTPNPSLAQTVPAASGTAAQTEPAGQAA